VLKFKKNELNTGLQLTYGGNTPVMLWFSAVDKFECHVSFA